MLSTKPIALLIVIATLITTNPYVIQRRQLTHMHRCMMTMLSTRRSESPSAPFPAACAGAASSKLSMSCEDCPCTSRDLSSFIVGLRCMVLRCDWCKNIDRKRELKIWTRGEATPNQIKPSITYNGDKNKANEKPVPNSERRVCTSDMNRVGEQGAVVDVGF